jgi:hypothetical protein
VRPQFLHGWSSAPGGEDDDDSDEDRRKRDRAPPVFPESAESVVALTTRPEESEQHKQSTR